MKRSPRHAPFAAAAWFLLLVLPWWNNVRLLRTMTGAVPPAAGGEVGAPLSSSSSSCDEVLCSFDATFDRMRAARQHVTSAMNLTALSEKEWFDPFEPESTCFTDERFGSRTRTARYGAIHDGPKFVCGVDLVARRGRERPGGCLVYSVGSNNDVSFERAVHDFMGCETHTFDPTLNETFAGGEYAQFHPWGLGKDGESKARNGKRWISKGLETIMKELGHENRTIDVLKMDCEGCEYTVLPPLFDLMASGRARVDQIQVELHARSQLVGDARRSIFDFFAAADRAGLRIFHKERNHWGCRGFKCVEYALASESFLRDANRYAICPSGGDASRSRAGPGRGSAAGTELGPPAPPKISAGSIGPLFDSDLIPENSVVDMNIGTNFNPLAPLGGRHRILVDPLFYVCDSNAKITRGATSFCFAVSNSTGFSSFYEYNKRDGVSSSLSPVSPGTSHQRFPVIAKRTVLVLEANALFSAIDGRNSTVYRLKLDMQGQELSVLRNLRGLLGKERFVAHIMAECFCVRDGKQIYQIDNSCDKIARILQEVDYTTSGGCADHSREWSNVVGYKNGLGLDFLEGSAWRGQRPTRMPGQPTGRKAPSSRSPSSHHPVLRQL